MNRARDVRRVLRRTVGAPESSGKVPARVPLVLERYRVLFDALRIPPLPAPLLLVHTAGKPLDYRAGGERRLRQSLPGLVTFVPASIRYEAALRGVGEGTIIYADSSRALPAWMARARYLAPVTITNEVIVALTRRLMHELEHRSDAAAYLRALGNALLAELQRELDRPAPVIDAAATRGELRVAHAAIQHMRAHLAESLPVARLARACGLGVTSFSQAFRAATGQTPHRYLRAARIDRAGELLRTTGLSILEVAEAVGFRGQAHFSTAFVAERGVTPREYRKAARAGLHRPRAVRRVEYERARGTR